MSKKNRILVELCNEVNAFQIFLLENGLITRYNTCIISGNNLTWDNCEELSNFMKEEEYEEIYKKLNESKNFSFQLIDGAIFQLSYVVNKKIIEKMRIAYYPSPDLLNLDYAIEEYEMGYEFLDMLDKYIVTVPIRIDYAPNQHEEISHPKTHIHLGQMEGCRIPLTSPIMPNKFFKFIFYNFYNKAYDKYFKEYNFTTQKLTISITDNEKEHGHIHL
ncbi:DUF2290 domain-containing protein [Cetobacterium sp.]|uniref:DUF2290 domain-containing protein n=2 Tax=Cetobacterium sp. TaxID=2071632 RepID=UPI003EE81C63